MLSLNARERSSALLIRVCEHVQLGSTHGYATVILLGMSIVSLTIIVPVLWYPGKQCRQQWKVVVWIYELERCSTMSA